MRKTIVLIFGIATLIACKKTENVSDKNTEKNTEKTTEISAETETNSADITLTAGDEQYKIKGSSGWSSVAGTHYIGAKDDENSLKTFSAFFNLENLPAQTTTYTLVKDQTDTDPTHIWMNITEIRKGGLFEYTSDDASGKLTLVVSGNKITADLSGIILQPSLKDPMIYENLNVGGFSKPGTLSGKLEFYKN